MCYNWQNIKVSEEGEIKTEGDIAPVATLEKSLGNVGDPVYDGTNFFVPVVEQKGNIKRKPIDKTSDYNAFTLRLLINYGQQEISANFSRCYGASLFPAHDPVPASAPWDMNWKASSGIFGSGSPYGLYTAFWNEWVLWRRRSQQVEFQKVITPLELMNIDFTRKYKIYDSCFLLDEINFTVTNQGIRSCKIKAWTI